MKYRPMLKSAPGKLFMLYLACLSMLSFLSTDIYLPAFEKMASSLATTPSKVSLTLSVFVAGMALGQMIFGLLAHRKGNRFALLLGLTIFMIATAGICASESIYAIIAWRVAQGFGASAASVIWQALVVERFDDKQTQHIFYVLMPLVALSPALAPVLGAMLVEHYSWKILFWILLGTGVLLFLITLQLRSPPQSRHKAAFRGASISQFFKHPVFMGQVLISSGCAGIFFAYLTSWPFVMSGFGYSPDAVGLSFIPQTICFLLGGQLAKIYNHHSDHVDVLPWLLCFLGGSLMVMVGIQVGWPESGLYGLLLPFCGIAFANGAIYPTVIHRALQVFVGDAALASSLHNTLQLGMSMLASMLVAWWISAAIVVTLSVMVLFLGVVGCGYYWSESKKISAIMAQKTAY